MSFMALSLSQTSPGWAELPIDVTNQAYVKASELAHSRGLGIWGDAPPKQVEGARRVRRQ